MRKQLLVTISDDSSCLYGVRFVATFFEKPNELGVTLFYVAPPQLPVDDPRPGRARPRAAAPAEFGAAEAAFTAGRRILETAGFDPASITGKCIVKQFGTVKDIVRESRQGLYDAVVLGRRGYLLLEAVFGNSVSRTLLDEELACPLWICRHNRYGERKVLLCVDGSSQALRMADHLGFMLAGETEHRVTLFQVAAPERESDLRALDKAQDLLVRNGFPSERIDRRLSKSTRVVKEVLRAAREGRYGVVAVGRAGAEESAARGRRLGSHSLELLKQLSPSALWVSQ